MPSIVMSIAGTSIAAFGAIFFGLQLTLYEFGFSRGQKRKSVSDQRESVGIIVGGMLGLLAFVLALTLSFANDRFSDRREGTLLEANAIGTAWLRAKAIGSPTSEEIATKLAGYIDLRKRFVMAEIGNPSINDINAKTAALQMEIWALVSTLVRERPDAISANLMTAINETFDAATSERFAFEFRLPNQVFWLLIGMTLVTMGCLGYQLGLIGRQGRILVALLSLMWTVVIVDILDLASTRLGSFRIDASVYDQAISGSGT
ncbi:MAG: hypothetical protein U1E16_09245 [Hyphomicrobiales bacterium]